MIVQQKDIEISIFILYLIDQFTPKFQYIWLSGWIARHAYVK